MTKQEMQLLTKDELIQLLEKNEENNALYKELNSKLLEDRKYNNFFYWTTIIILILTHAFTSCTHKETRAEKLAKQLEIDKVQYNKTMDSIDLEIIKLGGKP